MMPGDIMRIRGKHYHVDLAG